MDSKEYKAFHEKHMMDNRGSSIEECAVLLSAVPLSLFISSGLSSYFPKTFVPIVEFCCIIIPHILNTTIFSDVNYIVVLSLGLLGATIFIFKVDIHVIPNLLNSKLKARKGFITSYRASTNFFSALCILAVDFSVFPKRLGKTESFGFGLMDYGVGFFICSNGFVEKHFPVQNHFVKLLKSVSILIVLGMVRLVSIKSLNYHEHISEYGVHWNFFFTLALCRFVTYMITMITNYANLYCLALATGLIHEMLLVVSLQDWVLSDIPRNSFFSANREGLASCLGYVCLYFSASSLGKLIYQSNNYSQLLKKLVVVCFLSCIGTFILFKTTGISRRLMNLGYIFWVLFSTSWLLIGLIINDLCVMGLKKEKKQSDNKLSEPVLMESINSNALFFFLFCNLLTGLINSLFQTLLLGKIFSLIIITIYMAVLCSTNYFLYTRNIYLKL